MNLSMFMNLPLDAVPPNARAIDELLDERIAARDFPSGVYLVARGNEIMFAGARGQAVRAPQVIPATRTTIYDLASLTKPLITALLCMMFMERRALDIEKPVAYYLPEFERADKRSITTRDLLIHTSGLAAWQPLCERTNAQPEKTLDFISQSPLQYEPRTHVAYSDLGFITLGLLLERVSNTDLNRLAHKEIFAPLNLARTFFNPPANLKPQIAAAERGGNSYERQLAASSETDGSAQENALQENALQENVRQVNGCWRTGDIWGEVHDGNAYFLGGAAGHAGLFSTAFETLQLARQFISSHSSLLHAAATFKMFDSNFTENLNEARSLGWQLAATESSTAGTSLAPNAFGHTGFTGTSLWIDAKRELVFILLTNRTHNHALPFVNINRTRRRFHTLAIELVGV